jgi:hypothetical protein
MLKYQLTTTSTGREKGSRAIYTDDGDQLSTTASDQLRDHPAFSTEGHPVTRIFYITTGHDPTIVNERRNPNGVL